MNPIDDELKNDGLKRALRRQPAPDGFAERVMLRVEKQRLAGSNARSTAGIRDGLLARLARPFVRWVTVGAVAALVIAGFAEGIHYRRAQSANAQREHAEGEAAKQRLMLALHIAGSKLQLARAKVNQVSTNPAGAGRVRDQTEN